MNEIQKKIKLIKKNVEEMMGSSKELASFKQKAAVKKTEAEKLNKNNELFTKIKNDLEAKKKIKIDEYETLYKQNQDISKSN